MLARPLFGRRGGGGSELGGGVRIGSELGSTYNIGTMGIVTSGQVWESVRASFCSGLFVCLRCFLCLCSSCFGPPRAKGPLPTVFLFLSVCVCVCVCSNLRAKEHLSTVDAICSDPPERARRAVGSAHDAHGRLGRVEQRLHLYTVRPMLFIMRKEPFKGAHPASPPTPRPTTPTPRLAAAHKLVEAVGGRRHHKEARRG